MPTRPTQGGSAGTWGTELEANLAVSIDKTTGALVPAQVAAGLPSAVDGTGVLLPAAVRTALGGSIAPVGTDLVLSTDGVERGRIAHANGEPSGVFLDPTKVASVEEIPTATVLLSDPGTSFLSRPIYTATSPERLVAVWLCPTAAVAQNDTTYWQARLIRRPGKFGKPPVYIPPGSLATADGYYKSTILAEANLVDYWPLDETSGTSAANPKNVGNAGTYQTAAAAGVRGVPGTTKDGTPSTELAYMSDGVTSSVLLPSISWPWNAGGSYECWVFLDATPSTTATGVNALNSTTVNVGSTTGFRAAGDFVLGGVVVAYTGVTGTSFTGCSAHPATTGGEAIADSNWDASRRTLIGSENNSGVPSLEILGGNGATNTGRNGLGVTIPGTFVIQTSVDWPGLQPGMWHHIVYTRSAGSGAANHAFYVDGQAIDFGVDNGGTFLATAGAKAIGRRAAASQLLPKGTRIAHVAVYSSPLSATQIATHYGYGYEIVHKNTRIGNADGGEAMAAFQGWGMDSNVFGNQAILSSGDSLELQLEPFGGVTSPGAFSVSIRTEPI